MSEMSGGEDNYMIPEAMAPSSFIKPSTLSHYHMRTSRWDVKYEYDNPYLFGTNQSVVSLNISQDAHIKIKWDDIGREDSMADVSLICKGDVHMRCHKSDIGSHSTVFRAMLGPDSRFVEGTRYRIPLPDENPAIFKEFLYLIYFGKLSDEPMSIGFLIDLMNISDKYVTDHLFPIIHKRFSNKVALIDVSNDNFLKLLDEVLAIRMSSKTMVVAKYLLGKLMLFANINGVVCSQLMERINKENHMYFREVVSSVKAVVVDHQMNVHLTSIMTSEA